MYVFGHPPAMAPWQRRNFGSQFFSLYGSWRLNSGCQTWQQESLHISPLYQPSYILSFLDYFVYFVCRHKHAMLKVWWSEDHFQVLVLALSHVGLGNKTQILCFVSKCLYLLGYLIVLICISLKTNDLHILYVTICIAF